MLKYIIKRIAQAIPLLILITVICFVLINMAPYDAVDAITTPDMSAWWSFFLRTSGGRFRACFSTSAGFPIPTKNA